MNEEVKTETTETPVQEPTQDTVQTDTQPKTFEIPTEAQEVIGAVSYTHLTLPTKA